MLQLYQNGLHIHKGTIKPHIMALRGGGKVQEGRKGEKDEGREREAEVRGRREERERGGS